MLERLREATKGEYTIEKELGRGGMATVYLAHDTSLDRKVAIKVMAAELLASSQDLVDRFMREARTGARLNHPHIIPVYAVREYPQLIYFVMKFIDGKPLDDVIAAHGQLPVALVARIMAQVADALAYAHRSGVVHRDIKPGNMMLDREGWVVLTDLGIAKVQESKMTATGSSIGTPTYMSPEQGSAAKETTGASDQYSLGCVAYEMLAGEPPFTGNNVMALLWKHHTEPPPPLRDRRPDCPPSLVAVIERMLAKAPEDRFPSMAEVAQLFREAASGDEEEFRLLLQAYATGTATGAEGARLRTPTGGLARITGSGPETPRPVARPVTREVARTTANATRVTMERAAVGAAAGPSVAAGPGVETPWPRTMLKPAEAVKKQRAGLGLRFRTPGLLTIALAGFAAWLFVSPSLGDLATTIPAETALMVERRTAAEAAVRRGTAPGADGSCEGIRMDLPACRKHVPLPLAEIDTALVSAVLLAEDTLFRARQGADWNAMRRAAGYPREAFEWGNAVDRADLLTALAKLPQRMATVGVAGSLSQRLAQALFLPPDDGMFRKLREIIVAGRLDRALPRDRVLELYLNTAEFGPGLYGVEAAAQHYFGTSARKLRKPDAAALAATLATPRSSTPTTEPARMKQRQALLLRRLGGEPVAIPGAFVPDSTPRPTS
ncbi:MAG: protein kinase [Gemmatimonadales bacterium]|nr:protein kinase [Gemmatimonadales bacterium]